ncbi:hypothetical protein BH11PSE2_BH11PSE2_21850 [soil metagenome]
MKTLLALPLATALLAVVACTKPAETPAADSAPAATPMAADASGSTVGAGGAVSGPQPNGAINADGNTTNPDIAAASTSFTEGQAKGHIENAGYTDITGLMKTPDGIWTAKAKKDGKSMDVAVDFKGAVTAK